jgi:hypothetical protein
MRNDAGASTRSRTVESGVGFHAGTDWVMAALLLGAAVAARVYLPAPLVFDTDSPDFSPFGFLPLVLCAVALRYAIPALRGTLRSRRFGRAEMQLDCQTIAPGDTLRGVIRVPAGLAPLGDYEFLLQCVQQEPRGSNDSLQDFIRAEQTLRVNPQGVNARDGIPFAFVIPKDAMSTAAPSVMTSGSVRWVLEVKAPLKGLDFYAIYGVEVRAQTAFPT